MTEILHFEILRKHGQTHKHTNTQTDMGITIPRPPPMGGEVTTIEQTQCVKDLGIQMSVTLSFTDHINTICSKVRQKCGWIMRTFHTRDIHTMKTLDAR